MSFDDLPIIGPMSHFPNVILNLGYGKNTLLCFGGAKIVEDIIQPLNDNPHFDI